MGTDGWGLGGADADPWRVCLSPSPPVAASPPVQPPVPGTHPPAPSATVDSTLTAPVFLPPPGAHPTMQVRAVGRAPRRRIPKPTERILLVAVAVTACLLAGGVYGLVAVGDHGPRTKGTSAARHPGAGPATTAPGPTSTTTDAGATTTAPPPAPATAAGTSSGSGSGTHVVTVYGPANIVDPSPVATAVVPSLPLYTSPGAAAPAGHLANPNWLGAPLVLLVTGYQGDWVQAYIPVRPNETTAWFPRADVSISSDPYHIAIAIAAHQLVLYKNNVAVFSAPVATGAPDSPTPTGSYFVAFIVKLTDPGNVYGPYAMGTSDFSNTYYSFEGGPGQVGIHGTNQPWVIGSYASHGCIRMYNNDIATVAQQVPPGTPVEIAP